MNPEIAEKWAADLEANADKQGRHCLHYKKDGKDLFCCLGRLCELAIADGVQVKVSVSESFERPHFSYGNNKLQLPHEVKQWAGMKDNDAKAALTKKSDKVWLSKLNDDGVTFPEIAKLIREQSDSF